MKFAQDVRNYGSAVFCVILSSTCRAKQTSHEPSFRSCILNACGISNFVFKTEQLTNCESAVVWLGSGWKTYRFGVLKQENTESIHDSRVPPSKPQKLDLSRMPVPPKAFGMIDVSVSGNGFTCNCASEKSPNSSRQNSLTLVHICVFGYAFWRAHAPIDLKLTAFFLFEIPYI